MIDLHSHVLPGVDDGAGTLDESVAILRAAAEGGITRIAATPHVRADYPTSPDTMERGVDELNRAHRPFLPNMSLIDGPRRTTASVSSSRTIGGRSRVRRRTSRCETVAIPA